MMISDDDTLMIISQFRNQQSHSDD